MNRIYMSCILLSFIIVLMTGCSAGKGFIADLDSADNLTGNQDIKTEINIRQEETLQAGGADSTTVINDFTDQPNQQAALDDMYATGENMVEESIKDSEQLSKEDFFISEISDDIFARIYGKSFKENCTLSREELKYLHLQYIGFDGESHEGEMIVNTHIAEKVLDIFRQLYEIGYPIEKIRLVDEYDADDEASMSDNNSSAFNFRFISYTNKISKHGLGMAIDINPLYNPYVKEVDGRTDVEPANGVDYVDRDKDFEHKIDVNDPAYKLFTENGFEWGGSWKNSKDYQHFEVSTDEICRIYPDYANK